MKDFFNPNVKGGLRWIHIHLGLVLAILGTVFMVAANAPRPQSFPTRPQNVVVVPPVHFVPHATLRFVKHTSFCEAYPKRCPEPDHPSTSAMTRISSQAGWYVSPFYTYDTGLNISPIVNAAGDYYNIWPVYLLAVVFAESGGNQFAHRWGCGYGVHCNDVSFGLVQVTTNTLTGYYNGCGLNDYCAANYLYNPTVSIWLGARILHDYRNETGVSYLALWECYNAGPGSCQSPYYSAFLDAYYRATGYSTNAGVIASPTARPTPRPVIHYSFPAGHWKKWTHHHHKHPIIHALHHHLVWAASVWWAHQGQTYCGGITHKEQYFSAGGERQVRILDRSVPGMYDRALAASGMEQADQARVEAMTDMTHEEAKDQFQDMWEALALDPGSIDLGSDVHIRYYERDGVRGGFNEFHKTPAGKWCAGGVQFDIPEMAGFSGAKWTLNSIDPLDISPSVLCRACGHHGFIKQGRWVSC